MTVWLVAVEDLGAEGILLGSFGTGAAFLVWRVAVEWRRLARAWDGPLLRRMVTAGLLGRKSGQGFYQYG